MAMLTKAEFNEALEKIKTADRALLTGNGFSIAAGYFNYRTLFEAAVLCETKPPGNLFATLDTYDFEKIISALEDAAEIEKAYGHEKHANDVLLADATKIRNALTAAISRVHPASREDMQHLYNSTADFLQKFSSVFTLNYDLLTYWATLAKPPHLLDGFESGQRTVNRLFGPFSEDDRCNLFNLHGGLHLIFQGDGKIFKVTGQEGDIMMNSIMEFIQKGQFPVIVAEGDSQKKMQKINSVSYLRHCYKALQNSTADILFIYGHSASENDAHIYQAIFESKIKRILFGIHNPDDAKIADFEKILSSYCAKYRHKKEPSIQIDCYDSSWVKIWQPE